MQIRAKQIMITGARTASFVRSSFIFALNASGSEGTVSYSTCAIVLPLATHMCGMC